MDSYSAQALLTGRELRRHRMRGLEASRSHQQQTRRNSESLRRIFKKFDLNGGVISGYRGRGGTERRGYGMCELSSHRWAERRPAWAAPAPHTTSLCTLLVMRPADGELTTQEFACALRTMNAQLSDRAIRQAARQVDADGDGIVDYEARAWSLDVSDSVVCFLYIPTRRSGVYRVKRRRRCQV